MLKRVCRQVASAVAGRSKARGLGLTALWRNSYRAAQGGILRGERPEARQADIEIIARRVSRCCPDSRVKAGDFRDRVIDFYNARLPPRNHPAEVILRGGRQEQCRHAEHRGFRRCARCKREDDIHSFQQVGQGKQ